MENIEKKSWFSRHKILTAIIIIFVLAVIGSAIGGAGKQAENSITTNEDNNAAPAEKTESKPATTIGLNQAARDGKFEFTVKSIDCTKTELGNEYLKRTAQGKFCMVNMSIKNIGDKKQSLFSANQKLLDKDKKEYSADDQSTLYASANTSSTWYSDINPGNSVDGVIVFDVPKDVTPTIAELHDSAYSGGVKVSLN